MSGILSGSGFAEEKAHSVRGWIGSEVCARRVLTVCAASGKKRVDCCFFFAVPWLVVVYCDTGIGIWTYDYTVAMVMFVWFPVDYVDACCD